MSVLIIDDNPEVRLSAVYLLEDHGYAVLEADAPECAKQLLSVKPIQLILLDMNFSRDTTSGEEGLAFLRWLNIHYPDRAVICLTGWSSVNLAVEAMQLGACDFIEKPWQNESLLASILDQFKLMSKQKDNASKSVSEPHTDAPYQWQSQCMKALEQQLQKVAPTNATILLTGPSGVGKSHIAQSVHQLSARRTGPWVSVNMGSLSSSLFESEMFGHVKGAFTDAKSAREGRFTMARQGTLFLDEIGTLDISLQAKLLRVLESGEYERVGSSVTEQTDIRLICASNIDFDQAMAQAAFRTDLFYRINTFSFSVPRFYERRDDILPFAQYMLAVHAQRYGLPTKSLAECAKTKLRQYTWPGNVREVSHVMERALLLSEHPVIKATDCQLRLVDPQLEHNVNEAKTLADIEKSHIVFILNQCDGHIGDAAQRLGLTKSSLYRRIEKYGLKEHG
ncbi:sigma-54-dependent Fis family transcriptional regulator [Pseudoalteromonas aurantia]|uniref:Sigma-54-dependent Fis family transcriptional regulator n=1 Tax=Pseudoalteromonas aurantia TaxID=43654 RepID=A0A5S3VB95_9GAMM|nr:sigma-54 dependent transcriptional regulator [Pseudoalteromonas aurantia]TMO61605.1 sigma-54-dependent Fis family transcriptional regulator [Pseudoalteromonas aurantia]TMO69033.1 sigma-54-dependent Fis family transcriptional regulator [Pseudoalteromonas aurantia]